MERQYQAQPYILMSLKGKNLKIKHLNKVLKTFK
jgi:hypothetical protein